MRKVPIPRKWMFAGCVGFLIGLGLTLLIDHAGERLAVIGSFLLSGLVVLVGAFRQIHPKPPTHDALLIAARRLAGAVAEQEQAELRRLLADIGDPADIGFATSAGVTWHEDAGPERGSLAQIQSFYDDLRHHRLVIQGEPGSGKTVLAMWLLLDLIDNLPTEDPVGRDALRVPVRLSLPTFDPVPSGDRLDGGPESEQLDAWLIRQLKTFEDSTDAFGRDLQIADALVAGGWILPILDGLDEMDPRDGEPVKAAAVMRALNHVTPGGLRRVVVACRRDRYEQLKLSLPLVGVSHALAFSKPVTLDPLSTAQTIDYLTRRFPAAADSTRVDQRWQPIVAHIDVSPESALAFALRSPLLLFAAVTMYSTPGSAGLYARTPAELLQVPVGELEDHLIGHLVESIVHQHPGPNDVNYNVDDVTRWLTSVASYLHREGDLGRSASDLKLDHLWSAAGTKAPRYLGAALLGVISLVLLIPAYAWYVHTLRSWLPDDRLQLACRRRRPQPPRTNRHQGVL